MKNALTIIDDFLPNALEIRGFALSHDFTQKPEYDGHVYDRFAQVKDERFLRWLEPQLAAVIGADVEIKLGTFTCLLDGQGSPQWIHSDDICATHAAVLYLFDRPGYGTAFWRHRGYEANNLAEAIQKHPHLPETSFAATLQFDGKNEDAWARTDLADSKFNRLIIYPSNRFHSRAVQYGFGDKPENARLTLAVFFNITP